MVEKILIASITVILAGYGFGSGGKETDTPRTQSKGSVTTKKYVATTNPENVKTLSGDDSNANGLRDDIEAIITSNYQPSTHRASVTQTAKAIQNALLVDTTDILAVKAVDQEIARGINCIYSRFGGENSSKHPAQVAKEIEAITTNTKQRLMAYLRFNKALDGTHSESPNGVTCE